MQLTIRANDLSGSEDFLVARSQAKRLLERFDRFEEVVLDFDGVRQVGQGFADESSESSEPASPMSGSSG